MDYERLVHTATAIPIFPISTDSTPILCCGSLATRAIPQLAWGPTAQRQFYANIDEQHTYEPVTPTLSLSSPSSLNIYL